jgi:eukaryotic-like serine/threonine-protein kinase
VSACQPGAPNSEQYATAGLARLRGEAIIRLLTKIVSLAAGARLGPYEIVALVGAGGMGEIYKAKDTRLDRTVAVKILPSRLAADPHFRERFDREARTVSQLDPPHICALYDVGVHDGMAYLVMQYLEGETLADRLQKGPLPIDGALRCAVEILDALAAAHRAGITHRDLKPANIMLEAPNAMKNPFGAKDWRRFRCEP